MNFREFFGRRENAGFDKQAVPQNGPGETTEAEAGIIEEKRLRIEQLERKIGEIETAIKEGQDHPEREDLPLLNEKLRELNQ